MAGLQQACPQANFARPLRYARESLHDAGRRVGPLRAQEVLRTRRRRVPRSGREGVRALGLSPLVFAGFTSVDIAPIKHRRRPF